MFRGQGAVLKILSPGLGLSSRVCASQCQSTKSAIHAALKTPEFQDNRSDRGPRRPRTRPTLPPENAKANYPEKRAAYHREREERDSRNEERSHSSRHKVKSGLSGGLNRFRGLWKPEYGIETDTAMNRKASKFRQSTCIGQEDHHSRRPEEGEKSLARRGERHAGSSLSSFLPGEEIFGAIEHGARNQRTFQNDNQLKSRRPTEIDRPRTWSYDDIQEIQEIRQQDSEPLVLPYTTPASEFLYGHGVVTAALRARRRKFYKMYIYQSQGRKNEKDTQMREMAVDGGVPVEKVRAERYRLLDRMSEGRPHNGFVLEASPLPKLPITAFDRVDQPDQQFLAFLDHQTQEDEEINGTDPRIRYDGTSGAFPRFPFVLLLDGVLDPQNLGAIIRSAFFFGVDAIALTTDRTAPLSPAALKASAGASEAMPILTVNKTQPFLNECKKNGWKIYASQADPIAWGKRKRQNQQHLTTSTLVSDVSRRPGILIIGSEGQGLYKDVLGTADNTISIEGPRQGEMGMDSLNVSVATGLLCEVFLRNPAWADKKPRKISEQECMDLRIRNRLF